MNLSDRVLVVLVNALMLVTMFVVDSRPLRERARRSTSHWMWSTRTRLR